jgi:hypothetical protein
MAFDFANHGMAGTQSRLQAGAPNALRTLNTYPTAGRRSGRPHFSCKRRIPEAF